MCGYAALVLEFLKSLALTSMFELHFYVVLFVVGRCCCCYCYFFRICCIFGRNPLSFMLQVELVSVCAYFYVSNACSYIYI